MVSEPIEFFGPKSMAEEEQPLIGLQKKLQEKKHTRKLRRLKYSCEEVYERMDNGLCLFCDELDTPGHHDLKHKGIQIFIVDDDLTSQTQETVTKPEPIVETANNFDPFIKPLERASVLQVLGSVPDVLMAHRMDSHVKEVEESSQQSTNGNDKIVAHQLFDQMPNEYQKDLTVIESSNKEVLSFSHKDARVWEPGGLLTKMDHWDWFEKELKPHKNKSHQIETFEATDLLNKDPQEIIWDCVNKEFKETVAGCGNIITDRFKLVDETLKPAVYDGTNQIRVWDCGGSPLDYGDESPDDEKPDGVTVEGTSNKPVNMNQEEESNSENESRPEFSHQVLFSQVQHTPPDQYRAPFNPYQNCNDQCHYKREFGNYTEPGIEFDRASEEVEDDELQDKQPEDEIFGVDKSVDMIREDISTPENESSLEVTPQILLSQLRIFDDESHGTLGDHTLAPMKPYQSYYQSWYELDTIQSDINFKVLVAHECDMVGAVVIYEVATTFEKLAKTWKFKFKSNLERSKLMDDMFSFMEKSSEKCVMVWESHCRLLESQQELELSGWKYKKQINQGQICLNGLCNELVCDKEKKRDSIEFNECHNHLKKLQAALEGIPQKIAGGLIYGDVKFHLKHKWRSRLLQTLSRLEFCVDDVILFTSSVKLLFFTMNHKPLHPETGFCTHYNGLEQLSTEFQGSLGLDFFTYLIFKWNQALNCGCEAGHTSSGFFSVGDVYGFFTCSKLQTGDETQEKRLLFLNNNNKVDHTIKENWFHSEPMIRGVYHLQRPPELIELQGNPNFITKVLVQWKEHPPDQFFSGSQWQEFNFSSLRTRMFRRGKYCDRIISHPGSHKPDFSQSLLFMVQL